MSIWEGLTAGGGAGYQGAVFFYNKYGFVSDNINLTISGGSASASGSMVGSYVLLNGIKTVGPTTTYLPHKSEAYLEI